MTPFEQAILQEWRESLPAVLAGDDPHDDETYLENLCRRVRHFMGRPAYETAT